MLRWSSVGASIFHLHLTFAQLAPFFVTETGFMGRGKSKEKRYHTAILVVSIAVGSCYIDYFA